MIKKVEIASVNTAKLPVLSNNEKQELLIKIKNGDEEARDKFVNGNLRLVLSVIKRFYGRGENLDDLFQVGCVGLIKSIDNFDLSQNVQFSTYAVPMIIGEIRRYLRDNNSIRVSRSVRDLAYKAIAYKEKFTKENNREPTIEEIAKELEVEKEEIAFSFDAIQDPVSLQEPVFNDGSDSIYIMDQVHDTKNTDEKWAENITIAEGNTNFYVENKQLYTGTTLLKSYTGKENITVKDGTITIGNNVFCGEVNAKEITLPASVENIHSYIMQIDNSKLQKLKIGKNASNIPPQFNFGALNVQIELDADNKNYTIVNNVLYNYDKTKLICALYPITENLTIESTVKEISDYAFYGQEEIQGITLPNGIEKIGGNILLRCSKITKLEIPSSIKEISSAAFNETAHLDEVIIHKKEGSVAGSPWGATKGERAIKWVTD